MSSTMMAASSGQIKHIRVLSASTGVCYHIALHSSELRWVFFMFFNSGFFHHLWSLSGWVNGSYCRWWWLRRWLYFIVKQRFFMTEHSVISGFLVVWSTPSNRMIRNSLQKKILFTSLLTRFESVSLDLQYFQYSAPFSCSYSNSWSNCVARTAVQSTKRFHVSVGWRSEFAALGWFWGQWCRGNIVHDWGLRGSSALSFFEASIVGTSTWSTCVYSRTFDFEVACRTRT